MDAATDARRTDRIESVLALAAGRLPAQQRPAMELFVREQFRQLDDEDLAERSPEDLLGALLSQWQFGAIRQHAFEARRELGLLARIDHAVDLDQHPGLIGSRRSGSARLDRLQLAAGVARHAVDRMGDQVQGQALAVDLHRHAVHQERHVVVDDLDDAVG